ncbi:hypothetical protein SSHG_02374 [Streptomyces albidoflavus]|nr:hypothetical protein SSHG_02374 [Streptomyces albidoflavus]
MEICIAVADWARGPVTSDPGVPGGESTGATPHLGLRTRHRHAVAWSRCARGPTGGRPGRARSGVGAGWG